MTRYLAFGAVVAATLAFTVRQVSVQPSGDFDILKAYAEDQRVRQKLALRRQFARIFQATLAGLGKGEIGLRDASVRVYNAADLFSPLYLRMLPTSDPGKTIQESIARNLLAHVRDRATAQRGLQSQIPILETELRAIVSERGPAQ